MQFVVNIDQPQSLVSMLKLLPKGRKRNQGSWIFSLFLFAMMNDLSSLWSWHCFRLLVIFVSQLLYELTYWMSYCCFFAFVLKSSNIWLIMRPISKKKSKWLVKVQIRIRKGHQMRTYNLCNACGPLRLHNMPFMLHLLQHLRHFLDQYHLCKLCASLLSAFFISLHLNIGDFFWLKCFKVADHMLGDWMWSVLVMETNLL